MALKTASCAQILSKFPHKYQALSLFQKLILVKVFFPEKVLSCVEYLVEQVLGTGFMQQEEVCLKEILAESTPATPIMLMKRQGHNKALQEFEKCVGECKMEEHTLRFICHQSSHCIVESMIKQAAQEGKWVLAEECQVQASIRQKIEQVFQSLKTTEINKDFRLWLVTESTSFSAEFLKQCSRMAITEHRTFKQTLHRCYEMLPVSQFEDCLLKKDYMKITFACAILYGVIL